MQKHSAQLLLIVENDPDITTLLRTILKMKTNYQLLTATDGRAALQILDELAHASRYQHTSSLTSCPKSVGNASPNNRLPDLILTDLNMPGLNGWICAGCFIKILPTNTFHLSCFQLILMIYQRICR